MKKYSTHGIVLKSINIKDANKMYTIITPDLGKVTVLVPGVRKINSRRAGALDTLNIVDLSLSEDSKGYINLSEVKLNRSFKEIKHSLEKSYLGLYFAELVNVFLEEKQDSQAIYKMLSDYLNHIDINKNIDKRCRSSFELSILKNIGEGMNTSRCGVCLSAFTGDRFYFSYESGGLLCSACSRYGFEVSKDLADELRELNSGFKYLSSRSNDRDDTPISDNAAGIIGRFIANSAQNLRKKLRIPKILKELS